MFPTTVNDLRQRICGPGNARYDTTLNAGYPFSLETEAIKPCPHDKASGRTQWMIDILVNDIREGLPLAVVVAKDERHLMNLMGRIAYHLRAHPDRMDRFRRIIRYENSMIRGTTERKQIRETQGLDGYSLYIDHFAAGEI